MKKKFLAIITSLMLMLGFSTVMLLTVFADGVTAYYNDSGTLYSDENCNTPVNDITTITSIIVKDNVTSIGDAAFEGCSGLTSVTIPNGVTSIGDSAFKDCSGLTSVTIPNGVTSIGDSAFKYCSSLKSITIPASVTSIGDHAFYGCSGLTSIVIPDGVTSIGIGAFAGCSGLISVTIPNGVTSIGGSAFYGCSSLTSIIIPDGVTSIDAYAFSSCTSLTSIIIPDSVTSIKNYAFQGCSGLTSITIPNGVTSIVSCAFSGCSGLTSVTIPDKVTSIGGSAFSSCTSLTSIIIPDSVTLIEANAFWGCTNLNNSGVTVVYTSTGSISSLAGGLFSKITGFSGVGSIKKVIVADGVTSIGGNAFSSCTSLTSIIIPDSVTSIGAYAFQGCSGLTNITIPNGVTSIGVGALESCSGLTSVTIPDKVTSIGANAFAACSGLTSVTIPNGVTSIGDYAFFGCSDLTSITIPDKVTSIGKGAFSDCTGLATLTVGATPPTVGTIAFDNCPFTNPLIIAGGNTPTAIAAYKAVTDGNVTDNLWYGWIIPAPPATYAITVDNLTHGSITASPTTAASGTTVSLTVTPASGYRLKSGTLKYNGTAVLGTSFTMPAEAVTITAEFELIPPTTYAITVDNLTHGSITASPTTAASGTTVSLSVTPANGYQLKTGTLKYNGTVISDTSFTMPAEAVTITADFELIPSSPTNPSSPSSPPSSSDPKTITVIETPTGIENPKLIAVKADDKAFSQSVEVRLKDDPIAKEMVEKALNEKAVDLAKNVTIFPLDISLYVKGTNTKVQPANGETVEITVPIPTEMLSNKDNIKIVCVVDGKLQVLPTKVVLKDGVYCVVFTASHFSPYAFVVDKDGKLATLAAGAPIIDTAMPIYANGLPYMAVAIGLTVLGMAYKRKKKVK